MDNKRSSTTHDAGRDVLSAFEREPLRQLCEAALLSLSVAERQALLVKVDKALFDCIRSTDRFPYQWGSLPWFAGPISAYAAFERARIAPTVRSKRDHTGTLALTLSFLVSRCPSIKRLLSEVGSQFLQVFAVLALREINTVDRTTASFANALILGTVIPNVKRYGSEYITKSVYADSMLVGLKKGTLASAENRSRVRRERDEQFRQMALDYLQRKNPKASINELVRHIYERVSGVTLATIHQKLKGIKRKSNAAGPPLPSR